jgi:hypothetical protein
MNELKIALRVQREWHLAEDAETNPNADPSDFAPFGIMSYPPDYKRVPCLKDGEGKSVRTD